MKKIAITGGHFTPALALIETLGKNDGVQILFFGRKHATEGNSTTSVEYDQISKRNIKFIEITTGRLQRKFTRYTIPSLLKIPIGLLQSTFYLLKERPNVIVSFGGYLSVPVVFIGSLIGIPIISHEQASIPGLATKINSIFTQKLFLTWLQTKKFFEEDKIEVIGNLNRKLKGDTSDKNLEKFLSREGKLIFVMGGNQGSHFLNEIIFELVDKMSNINFLHQVGTTNFAGDLDRSKKIKKDNYFALDYLGSSDFAASIKNADLVISRSGANTVWDLGLLGKVSILVPLPIAAGNEQFHNAKILEKAGSAVILSQKSLTTDQLEEEIKNVFKNFEKYQKEAQQFSKTLPQDATEKFASYVLESAT
ncbi:MAG: UDP-N-acetylglucosamine--N-acetylmuramyl-(pentapeptide) pyrophosphoryl-undecaprenol N-acetylglucosamine transferase [Candidatus Curtissbacteria bacterium]|nr:UDP-N-acetylglucosamine--N-acetylmuramyl-(pentapeptide) pyrophosphoryl-undecaprenol N-acetylglucosamine transferase [Candidatus Curtissbacteria bacterium]